MSKRKNNIIYGIHPLIEAIEAGKDIDKILIQKGVHNEVYFKIRELVMGTSIPYQFVPAEKLKRITTKAHQGVIAFVSPITYYNIEDIVPALYEAGKIPLILILDGITDVRNIGAIARSAECFGVHALVVPAKGSAQLNEDAVKSSAGALMRVPVCRDENLSRVVDYLKNSGLKIVSTSEKSETALSDAELTGPLAMIMGSEEKGVDQGLLSKSDLTLKIPMTGLVASLNVSVASGIVLFEVSRNRPE
ncbi:MAG: 23S rRNA (guanosine(2251)-2'-O)-methyltransferase RlmB [Bacteroidales bacterium]|nr:23S rRNA (guanosine(2251)-2'-O)-methyltransferase RlmB [Bacteroidales bacterium]MCF8349669.1 23S rRNA (guanosine(2251)-2'-O)-methyltransferase RlmB [Bacteroidales bacterium]MCF8374915.1 23S rRNA (guanosine(2251)-2'-O)-methyltransferase RlmB [Bacteroidales bacterium]MCF8400106.1 23S rRNA (guanosine(2251)-2'-O)-methyltransferase RlmB [Bacteroidales bacterium]